MKILITGYKGFIGQNMVNALKEEHELTLFEWGEELPDLKGLEWCIHLGANSSTTETDVDLVMEQNYDFSRYLLNQCLENNINFQYASSASVYGNTDVFTESVKLKPSSPYSWSKYLFDRYVVKQEIKWSMIVQGFRYFNVYGPHEDHKGDQASPFHKFEQQAKETGVIKIFENSQNFYRDFIHVNDVIETHKKFFNVKKSGIWNLGTGTPRSFLEIAQTIAKEHNATIEFIPMPEHIAKQYQPYTHADMRFMTETLNESDSERNV